MAYGLPYTEVNGTTADATQVQANFVALLGGLNNSFAKDGSLPATGPFAMGGYRLGNVGTPLLPSDAATMGWVQGLGYITNSALSPYATTASLSIYSTTAQMNSALAVYAPLDSPALTGAPTTNGSLLGTLDFVGSATVSGYVLLMKDRGQTVFAGGAIVIPANSTTAFPLRTIIRIVNLSGSPILISCTELLILAGTNTSGNRTLANNGIAKIVKLAVSTWLLEGTGVS